MSYDLEMYAKALEAMAEQPGIRAMLPSDDPFEYAKRMTWERGYQWGMECAHRQAAAMLRMQPMTLWTVYPDHFPDPDAPQEDSDG